MRIRNCWEQLIDSKKYCKWYNTTFHTHDVFHSLFGLFICVLCKMIMCVHLCFIPTCFTTSMHVDYVCLFSAHNDVCLSAFFSTWGWCLCVCDSSSLRCYLCFHVSPVHDGDVYVFVFIQFMTMMFEVQDLSVASPATVSRCGMVYLEPSILGLQPFVECWLKKLPDALYDHKDTLERLFDSFLEVTP